MQTPHHAKIIFSHGIGDDCLRNTPAAQMGDAAGHSGDGRKQMTEVIGKAFSPGRRITFPCYDGGVALLPDRFLQQTNQKSKGIIFLQLRRGFNDHFPIRFQTKAFRQGLFNKCFADKDILTLTPGIHDSGIELVKGFRNCLQA